MSTIITAENVGKKYLLGQRGLFHRQSLRENVSGLFGKKREQEEFWALKDVSFDVQHGDRLGIIGRNGAGKSTLLKILSRITHLTKGKVHIRGRVSSLLEVGTGFHPELTGRENIYLNGSILGMSKRDIRKRLDEIVAFSEIEQFLDTPAKRYSSGMYVRLAFAVAAHLEPEILIVDEVLAVGDIGFQRKCLGKMRDVGREGRTVILVSHSMQAIEHLCSRVVIFEGGRKSDEGQQDRMILTYLNSLGKKGDELSLADRVDRQGSGNMTVTSFSVVDAEKKPTDVLITGKDYTFRFGYRGTVTNAREIDFSFTVRNSKDHVLFRNSTVESGVELPSSLGAEGFFECEIPRLNLTGGRYSFSFRLAVDGVEEDSLLAEAGTFDVIDGDYFKTSKTSKVSNFASMLVDHSWQILEKRTYF